MAMTIALETERGEQLELIRDPSNVVVRTITKVMSDDDHCLGVIDPYGDTVFNNLQAPRFLSEWQRCAKVSSDPESIRVVEGVRRLAERVRDEVHVYLKFYGD